MYLGPKLLQPCGSVDGAPGGAEKRGLAGLALAVKTFMFVLPLLKPPPSAAVRRDDEVVVPSGPGCIAKQPLLFRVQERGSSDPRPHTAQEGSLSLAVSVLTQVSGGDVARLVELRGTCAALGPRVPPAG